MVTNHISRRLAAGVLLACLALAPVLSFHQSRAAQTPEVGAPAGELLAAAAQEMQQNVQSMHFDLVYEDGHTNLYRGIRMNGADGAIVRPDRLKATVEAKLKFLGIDLNVTSIGGTVWVDAVGINDTIQVGDDIAALLNDPIRFLPEVAAAVENPTVKEIEDRDGEPIIWVEGTFNPELLQDSELGPYAEAIGVRPVEVALNAANQVVSVRMAGKFIDQDSDDVVRRLDFSGFNDQIEIEEP